jgi:type IV secretory pathway VirB2 component (pilin)
VRFVSVRRVNLSAASETVFTTTGADVAGEMIAIVPVASTAGAATRAEWDELADSVLEFTAGFFSVVLAVAACIVSAGVRAASPPVRVSPVDSFAAALVFPLPFSVS